MSKDTQKDIDQKLYILRFILNTVEPLEYLTLMAFGDEDAPIVDNNKLVVFTDIDLAKKALELADENIKKLGPPPMEIAITYDIPQMIILVESHDVDNESIILNCLNIFLDFTDALKVYMPEHYRNVICKFADYLTFERNYSEFFGTYNVSRSDVLDSIKWTIDAIFSRLKVLQ